MWENWKLLLAAGVKMYACVRVRVCSCMCNMYIYANNEELNIAIILTMVEIGAQKKAPPPV